MRINGIVHTSRKSGRMQATILDVIADPDAVVVVATEQRRQELVRAKVPDRQIIVLPCPRHTENFAGALARCRWPM